MQRVLSFQMTRNIGESSEYVTKRLCFSFLFSVGFLCLLCGFLLGRFAAERSMETQAQKIRGELAGNGLRTTEHLQRLALLELTKASFDYEHAANGQTADLIKANIQRINEFFSNLSFVYEITNHTFCVCATVHGSREPDRYVILSVNGDGNAVALELAQILDKICSAHDWRPRRSLMFCVSLISSDVCSQTLPTFIQRKVVAYIAVHSRFTPGSFKLSTGMLCHKHRHTEECLILANDHVALSGSDVIRSIAVEAIKTIPDYNWTYLENEMSSPRLSLNIPQVIFFFNDNNFANSHAHYNQSMQPRGVTLTQMVSQTMWRLSESIIIQWEPKYFNKTVIEVLESINNNKFQVAKEKLKRILKMLLEATKDLNAKIDATENTQTLRVRIWNDLLLDLDKELLCFDESLHHSRTDLVTFKQVLQSTNTSNTLNYLDEIAKCYKNAIQILQERT